MDYVRPFLLFLCFATACSPVHTEPYRAALPEAYQACGSHSETPVHRLLLIGDAGDPNLETPEPALAGLSRYAAEYPDKTSVVFLGDNIYSSGLSEPEQSVAAKEAREKGKALLAALQQSGAKGVFIPGNHDWSRGGEGVCRQAEFFDAAAGELDVSYLPKPCGCGGPSVLELEAVKLIALDTTWLRKLVQERINPINCPIRTLAEFEAELKRLLDEESSKPTVLVGHHGILSYGVHGKFYDLEDHFFPANSPVPLPLLGTLLIGLHSTFGCALDFCSPLERSIVQAIRRATKDNPPTVYAAGHDHSLQVLEGGGFADTFVISGGGSASVINEVSHGPETLFAQTASGFVLLDFFATKRLRIGVVVASEQGESKHAVQFCAERATN